MQSLSVIIYIQVAYNTIQCSMCTVYIDGEVHVGGEDDSFTRFNLTMVQQYFREEAVHQQHKVHK